MQKQAYEKLFAIAKAALTTSTGSPNSSVFLLPEQLAAIALDYAVSALEAYVNYLGYIFIDAWPVLQRKHFWGQYEQISEALAKLNIELPEEPIINYRSIREKRNHLHHAQAMSDDQRFSRISVDDAKQAVDAVAHFMSQTHKVLQVTLANYESFEAIWLRISEDNQLKTRKALYQSYIHQSFTAE